MAVFDFRDASLKGDRTWIRASRFTQYAPPVVLTLLILAIVQIVVGVVWVVSIQSAASDLSFGQVIQPIIVPGLAFFNTIPSLHLHVLARSNNPLMAMIFSGIMAGIYLASAIVFLPPCAGKSTEVDTTTTSSNGFAGADGGGSAYERTECPAGSRRDVWTAMVVLQFLSVAGYLVHFAMAFTVRRVTKRREADEKEGRVMVVIDQAEKAKREEEARQRWREIRDL